MPTSELGAAADVMEIDGNNRSNSSCTRGSSVSPILVVDENSGLASPYLRDALLGCNSTSVIIGSSKVNTSESPPSEPLVNGPGSVYT